MSYHDTQLGLRIRLEPGPATETIMAALRAEGVNVRAAAKRLNVTERSLHRYLVKLGLSKRVDELRSKAQDEGWLRHGGWDSDAQSKIKLAASAAAKPKPRRARARK
jgi:hypothetical protein